MEKELRILETFLNDSLLMTDQCGAHTFPYIECENSSATVEHEATTSKIGEDQLFYCVQRGISEEKAISLIVNGYAKEVLNKLPMEFAVEAQKLLEISLEGSVDKVNNMKELLVEIKNLECKIEIKKFLRDLI